jgi:hypothetical protein
MTRSKPLLIFDGNCQAQHLSAMILSTGIADTIHVGGDWGFIPAHRGFISRMVAESHEADELASAKAKGARLIQISQVTPRSKHVFSRGELDAVDKRVTFPEVRFWATSQRRFVEQFKADIDVERILQLDFDANTLSQQKSAFPVDVAGFIQREVINRPLFHTVNHPCGAVFSRLLEGLAGLLSAELDASVLLALAKEVEFNEGLNFVTDHPVPIAVRKKLGLNWGPNYEIYAAMILAGRKKAWTDLVRDREKYAALFSNDTQYWKVYAMLGAEQDDASVAVPAFERLLDMCPGVVGPWQHYAKFLYHRRNWSEIRRLVARAEAFFGSASALHTVAARAYLMLRDYGKAEEHARELWRLSPENIKSVVPLIQVLLAQRRVDEAVVAIASVKGRSAQQVQTLRVTLEKMQGSDPLIAALHD